MERFFIISSTFFSKIVIQSDIQNFSPLTFQLSGYVNLKCFFDEKLLKLCEKPSFTLVPTSKNACKKIPNSQNDKIANSWNVRAPLRGQPNPHLSFCIVFLESLARITYENKFKNPCLWCECVWSLCRTKVIISWLLMASQIPSDATMTNSHWLSRWEIWICGTALITCFHGGFSCSDFNRKSPKDLVGINTPPTLQRNHKSVRPISKNFTVTSRNAMIWVKNHVDIFLDIFDHFPPFVDRFNK